MEIPETSVQLTDKDIDERVCLSFRVSSSTNRPRILQIARAVEAEVARRLKEREDREREEKGRLQQEKENFVPREKQDDERRQTQAECRLPAGVLTPLLTRHRDLDDQLRARLAELEQK